MRRKLFIVTLSALVASLLTAAPVSAKQQAPEQDGTSGGFAVQDGRVHSSQLGTPSGADTLTDTTPLPYGFEEGDSFSYASAGCETDVPFNDTSLVFRGEGYPDVESPAPARYILSGTVTDVSGQGGTVEGTLEIIYCEGQDETLEGDRIFVDYQARFTQKSVNSLPLRGGSFEITGGTGRFADISGEGSFRGELTCLQGTLENAEDDPQNCAELGFFSDAAFDLRGSYQDPTVPTS